MAHGSIPDIGLSILENEGVPAFREWFYELDGIKQSSFLTGVSRSEKNRKRARTLLRTLGINDEELTEFRSQGEQYEL